MKQKTVKGAAFQLLAMKSRTTQELRKKLTLKGFDPQEIEEVLFYCQKAGYLNDDQMAKRKVEQLEAKGYGPRYIQMKLKGWGLKNPGLSKEQDTIRTLLKKPQWQRKTPQQKAAALARRGFSTDAIMEHLR
ncbi:MAG: regulatory protein RecX [Verrucomicrobia bacterium]|nr:regulatory protein RecX [Verrucomicrobiota bacterium]